MKGCVMIPYSHKYIFTSISYPGEPRWREVNMSENGLNHSSLWGIQWKPVQGAYKHVFNLIIHKVGNTFYSQEVVQLDVRDSLCDAHRLSTGVPVAFAKTHYSVQAKKKTESPRLCVLGAHSWPYLPLQCKMCLCNLSILSWSTPACSSERNPNSTDKGSLSL